MTPNIELVRERIAKISIGPSTLRNQGGKGVIHIAQEFLFDLDLRKLSDIRSDKKFKRWLEKKTRCLMERFPRGARRNWGAARKALNIFLEAAFYNRFLAKEYKLYKLERFLEVPLDRYVVREGLEKEAKCKKLPKWTGIKCLTSKNSKVYQQYASELASRKGIARIYLDLEFWRRSAINSL